MELKTLLRSPEGFNAIELGKPHPKISQATLILYSIAFLPRLLLGAGIGVVSTLLTALLVPWEATPARRILATDLGEIHRC